MNKGMHAIKAAPLFLLETGLAIFLGFPFLFALFTSFKTQKDYFTDPVSPVSFKKMTLDNYMETLDMGFIGYFINSLMVVAISTIMLVVLSTLASYALVRLDFKINKLLLLIIVSGMMLPIHASLIPIFILENKLGIYDTLIGLILPQVAFAIPISVFITIQFLEGIPSSIIEAANVDGANHYTIFLRIISPLLKPAIVTVVIYNGVKIWNNFSFALVFTQSKTNYTIPLGLQEFYGEFSVNVPGILSAVVMATIPILIIYFFMQETIERGLTGGAVKG